jgi:hypothetical protein
MIIGNIEIVTIIVVLLFLIPVLWNTYKGELFKKNTFIGLVRTFNKSLKIQGILAFGLIPISGFWNKFDFIFDYIIGETVYTYIVVGIFMYLPSLAFLNLIKLILETRIEKNNKSLKNEKRNQ